MLVKRALGQLYVQVLIGMAIGVAVGVLWPDIGAALKPLADAFVKLIKMLLAPVIFGTVVVGIARMGDLKDVGRIGLKALVYFEILTSIALLIGLVVANVVAAGRWHERRCLGARCQQHRQLTRRPRTRKGSCPSCSRSFPTASSAR